MCTPHRRYVDGHQRRGTGNLLYQNQNRPFYHKGSIATFYCDVPTEKVIFKSEQMHVRI